MCAGPFSGRYGEQGRTSKLILKSWGHDLAARNRAERTIKDHQQSLDRFSAWCEAQGLDLLAVTRHHIRQWMAEELGRISAKTTNRHYQAGLSADQLRMRSSGRHGDNKYRTMTRVRT